MSADSVRYNQSLLDTTHYIPCGLTSFQIELVKILIKLHLNSLKSQRKSEQSPNNLNGLLNSSNDDHFLSTEHLNNLLIRNLSLISIHPFLLVEHYMPKQLLLMESHERLSIASDVFNKFDKLITSLQGKSLVLYVIGTNLKELDLIEAFLLGRDLKYYRDSGTKLYDDHVDDKDDKDVVVKDDLNDGEKIGNSDEIDDQNNGKINRIDDYTPRIKKQSKSKPQLILHLTTTQNLLNHRFIDGVVDAFISFDPELSNGVNLQKLRINAKTGKVIPFIKLLTFNSIPHGEVTNQGLNKLELIYSSLVESSNDHTTKFDEKFGLTFKNVSKFFDDGSDWPIDEIPDFIKHTESEFFQIVDDFIASDIEHNKSNKKIKLEDEIKIPNKITLNDYKSILTKLTISQVLKIEEAIELNSNKLKPLRLRANLELNKQDSIKLTIGENFRKVQTLKETNEAISKKNERLNQELKKYETILNEVNEKLKRVKNGASNSDNDETELNKLKEELSKLQIQNKTKDEELNDLRSEYQKITNKAVEKSLTSKQLQSNNDKLLAKLKQDGLKLRKLKNQEIKIEIKDQTDRLVREIEFLSKHDSKLQGIVKEKISSLTIGRNGRVYRSTTPYS